MSSALVTAFADYLASALGGVLVLDDPAGLEALHAGLEPAPVALVVRPPSADPADLAAHLPHPPLFDGWTRARQRLAVVEPAPPCLGRAPDTFRVVAVVPTYNEADIIEHTLRYLMQDGIQVYVLDNWSTDATFEIARRVGDELGGLVGLERFPASGPSASYDLRRILARVEEVAADLQVHADAGWVVLHDADERRRGPWPGLGLRDGLYAVEQRGFNCVDHITLTFWPTRGGPTYDAARGQDVEDVLRFFEFSNHPGHFHQRRAWKQVPGQRVELAATAGHDVQFPGRRVFPYRFLLKHYPIRSQAHGERKVFAERRPRWNTAERAFGWHAQYDQIVSTTSSFVRPASELTLFDPATFYADWLIERLSGVGIFAAPPAWATPPVWRPLAPAA